MLAVGDIAFLFGCLLKVTVRQAVVESVWIAPDTEFRRLWWPMIELVVWPTSSIAMVAAIWMVILVTADRYLVVCWPMKAMRYSTMTRARIAVGVVWLIIIAGHLPRFFERQTIETMTAMPLSDNTTSKQFPDSNFIADENNTTELSQFRRVIQLETTSVFHNSVYRLFYLTTMFFVFQFLLPFGLLSFFNHRLIRSVRQSGIDSGRSTQSRDRNKDETEAMNNERRLTKMLIVIVSVFLICVLPIVGSRVYDAASYFSGFSKTKRGWLSVMYINVASNFLLPINSSANFFIYCLMGRRFRQILKRAVCCNRRL